MDNNDDELNEEEISEQQREIAQQEHEQEEQQYALEEEQKEQQAAQNRNQAMNKIGGVVNNATQPVRNAANDRIVQPLKNQAKKGAKQAMKAVAKVMMQAAKAVVSFVIAHIWVILLIILIAALAYGVIKGIFDRLSRAINDIISTDYVSEQSTYDTTNGLNIDYSNGIEITDEQLDQLIDTIESNGLTLRDLFLSDTIDDTQDENSEENRQKAYKYLRQFLRAQLVTEFPDFGITEDATHFNGIIKIKKASQNSDESTTTDMEYVSLKKFKSMINAIKNNSTEDTEEVDSALLEGLTLDQIKEKIKNVYTIDGSGNLYVANWHTTEKTENDETTTETTVEEQAVNYLKTIEKYSMPMQVLLDLCFTTQNPNYVYDFVEEHVLTGEIVLTVQESQSIDAHVSWDDWQITTKTETTTTTQETIYKCKGCGYEVGSSGHNCRSAGGANPGVNAITQDRTNTSTSTSTDKYEKQNYKREVNTDVQCNVAITSVDTWMFSQTVDYTNTQNMEQFPLGQEEKVNENATYPGTFDTYQVSSSGNTTTKNYYTLDYCHHTDKEKIVYNEWQKGNVNTNTSAMESKADSIIEQWKNVYEIPNSNVKQAPLEKIFSGEEWILSMLNQNEKTQKQAEIIQFLIKRAKNSSYDISNLDTSVYDDVDLETIDLEEDITVDVTRSDSKIVLSKENLRKAIQNCYSGDAETNLLGALEAIYNVQTNNKVNGVFIIAIVTQESSAGTNWAAIDKSTYNWASVTASSGYTDSNGVTWARYSSFSEATRKLGSLLQTSSYYFAGGNYTVKTIGAHYCSPPEGWINGVISHMKKMYKSVGVDLDAERRQRNRPTRGGGRQGDGTFDGDYGIDNGGSSSSESNSNSGSASSSIDGENGSTGEGNEDEGYWGTYTKGGKTYKLYYQNCPRKTPVEWGTGHNGLCVCTAYAIMGSASGGGDVTAYINSRTGYASYNSKVQNCPNDETTIMNYINSGHPVMLYRAFDGKYHASGRHALVLLDAKIEGSDKYVFVVNPWYISDGNGGQTGGRLV